MALFGAVSGLAVAPGCQIDDRSLARAALDNGGSGEPSIADPSDAGSGGVEDSAGASDLNPAGAGGALGGSSGQANSGKAGGGAGGQSGSDANAGGAQASGGVTSQGGMSASGGNPSTAGGKTSTGGALGSAGGAPVPCTDLDGDGVSDCSETLLKNATFDLSFVGTPSNWQLDSGATASWDSLDSMGSNSGSVVVTTSASTDAPGVDQCVALQTGKSYEAYALTLTQAAAPTGFARMSAIFYPGPDCSGSYDRVVVSALDGTINSWRTLHVPVSPALNDGSVRVRLEVLKANGVAASSVHFDNVLLSGK